MSFFFPLRGKLEDKRGNYIKSQLFLFYKKTDKAWMSKRATEVGITQGIPLKHNAFTQYMKD